MTVISDIMNKRVVAVRPETTLGEAVDIFTQNHIGGAPVVSGDGALVGVISEPELIDVVFDASAKIAPVSKYMTSDVQCLHPGDPLSRAAQLFALHSFRRLPVMENAKLVGIVSLRDLMNHSLLSNEVLTEPLLELIPDLGQLS